MRHFSSHIIGKVARLHDIYVKEPDNFKFCAFFNEDMLGGGSMAAGGYVIGNSVYGDGSTGYFSRTNGVAATDGTKATISFWCKRWKLGGNHPVIDAGAGAAISTLFFRGATGEECLEWNDDTTNTFQTTAVFRDVSAFAHGQIVWDSTQATASDRIKLYIDGTQITSFSSSNFATIALNETITMTENSQAVRLLYSTDLGVYSPMYLADFHLIDGQALAPSYFGETDSITGSWKPKAYTGTYGNNGFHLDFANGASLGADSSGNGNNFTKTGTVTQTTDSPTDDATNNIGNFCTWNPIALSSANVVPSLGNLKLTQTNDAWTAGTLGVSSGKWYWEIVPGSGIGGAFFIGIVAAPPRPGAGDSPGIQSIAWYSYKPDGNKYDGTTATAYGASYTTGDVVGVALDLDAGTLTFYKNNTSQGTAFSGLTGIWFPLGYQYPSGTTNFGQTAFSYTPPTGFKRLCTANLPAPTIKDAGAHFAAVTYTGNGSTQSITGVGFQPDFVWIKRRDSAASHALFDAVRGATKYLSSDSTAAEVTDANSLTSFNADGFSLGNAAITNTNTATYVAWCWKMNGAGASNTDGTITTTVSANTTAGMSIVKWTGTAANATVGHGLGAVPKLIIAKANTQVTEWPVYHASLANTEYAVLNTTAAKATGATYWNSTSPTSSVFSLGSSTNTNNTNGMIAYCFAEVPGFSKFGSYIGNGSADGPFVHCGFRPKYVLIKRTDSAAAWYAHDTARNTYNVVGAHLWASNSLAESSPGDNNQDFLSNGFKCRDLSGDTNASGGTYIFAAFAEYPFGGLSTTQGKAR